jgi:hypothetical protein
LTEKIKVGILFEKMIFTCLEDCLNKFCRKDVEPSVRSYIETVISISFFKVPFFNEMFLECLEDDIEVPEWRGIDWALDEDAKF